MIDAHCHLDIEGQLFELLTANSIPATINCQTTKEWLTNKQLVSHFPFLSLSAGIHPWDADQMSFSEFLPILEEASIIGEIGMDNEWTSVPLTTQEMIFRKQLAFASEHNKPVILHTKGMEKQIANVIQEYPNTYLVHWYSSLDYLENYLELDTYFTVGPSLMTDPAVQQVIEQVPLERLLFESDGLEALAWAKEVTNEQVDYLSIQQKNLEQFALLKDISYKELVSQLKMNYSQWINKKERN